MRLPKFPHFSLPGVLVLSACFAVTPAWPQEAGTGASAESPAALRTVYVADPAAGWFEAWSEASLKADGWLYRPDIRIKSGADMLAAVASDPSAIGLISRGELARLETEDTPIVTAAPTGQSVCAAFSVNAERPEDSFGDFALNHGSFEVLVTADTLAIAEALARAHGLHGRMIVKLVRSSEAQAQILSGKPAMAAFPVLPGGLPAAAANAPGLRFIGLSRAAAGALEFRGFVRGGFRTSLLHQLPLVEGVATACDEIVRISARDPARTSGPYAARGGSWFGFLSGSDLEMRVRQALDTLISLWRNDMETRG